MSIRAVIRDLVFPPAVLKKQLRDSERSAESVRSWWDIHHRKRSRFWLTGSSGRKEWRILDVGRYLHPGLRVLNIGIGLGHGTKALSGMGCIVDALDISRIALERVKYHTQRQWLADELPGLPESTYDLAMSFLVAQHMSHADLKQQFMHVIAALKRSGVFAIHVPRPLDSREYSSDAPADQKSGSVLRSVNVVSEMVAEASGRIIWHREIARFPEYGAAWVVYHVSPLPLRGDN